MRLEILVMIIARFAITEFAFVYVDLLHVKSLSTDTSAIVASVPLTECESICTRMNQFFGMGIG